MGLAEEMRDMSSDGYMKAYENSKASNCEKENAQNKSDDKIQTPRTRYEYGPGIGKNFQTKMEVTNTLVNTKDIVYIVTMSNRSSEFGEYYFLMKEFDGKIYKMTDKFYDKENDLSKQLIEFQIELSGDECDNYCDMCYEDLLITALNEITIMIAKNTSNNRTTHVYIEGPIKCVQNDIIKDFATAVIKNDARITLITPCPMRRL